MKAFFNIAKLVSSFSIIGVIFVGCSTNSAESSTYYQPSHVPATSIVPKQDVSDNAFIGGTPSGFAKIYGSAISKDNSFQFSIENIMIQIDVGFEKGKDQKDHAININISPIDIPSSFTFDEGTKIMNHFLPLDALFLRTATKDFTDHVYHSDTLSLIFPTPAFVDDNNNVVTSGTFDWSCMGRNTDSKVSSCLISLGQH